MEALETVKSKVFKTLYDITRQNNHKGVFLNGFLIPSKGVYEIWFPYSIEAAKLLKPGIFLAVKNFASIRLSDTRSEREDEEEHYSILEVVDVDIVHYKIKELSESPQNLKIEEAFEKFMEEWYRHAHEQEKETLKIIVKAMLHDEELVICTPNRALELGAGREYFFTKSTELPISGERVFIVEPDCLKEFINGDVPRRKLSFKAGRHKIFGAIPVYIDQEPLFNRHFAVFGFTGAGKSNLMSTLVRKALLGTENPDENPTNILVFDINNEYLGLLFDVLLKRDGALVFIDDPGGAISIFLRGYVNREILEKASKELVDRTTLPRALAKPDLKKRLYLLASYLFLSGKVRILTRGRLTLEILGFLQEKFEKVGFGGQGGREKKEVLMRIFLILAKYIERKGLVGANFSPYVDSRIREVLEFLMNYLTDDSLIPEDLLLAEILELPGLGLRGVNERIAESVASKLETLINEYRTLAEEVLRKTDYFNGITEQELILKTHDNASSLFIFVSEDDNLMRDFAYEFGNAVYKLRKNGHFQNPPQTVFIFEEADLFIPYTPTGSKEEKASIERSKQVATMLARRGRKYNLGLAIATQRVTYLDTGITAQLATYFVSKLPKKVDRERVAEAFGIEASVLDRTLSYFPGEWMVLTHVDALYRKAVPVPIKFENANDELLRFIGGIDREKVKKQISALVKNDLSTSAFEEKGYFVPLPEGEDLTPCFVEV